MTIIDDELFEYTENFDLELRFDPFIAQPPSEIILRPNVSTISILDDGGNEICCLVENFNYVKFRPSLL